VDCRVDRQQGSAKGPLVIQATCPSPKGLHVGLNGTLVAQKTGVAIKDGGVRIKTVSGNKIVVEAVTLKRAVPDTKLRFYVYR
jgi:hypothetical protein